MFLKKKVQLHIFSSYPYLCLSKFEYFPTPELMYIICGNKQYNSVTIYKALFSFTINILILDEEFYYYFYVWIFQNTIY